MRYVIIGASAAGCNAIREIRDIDKDNEIVLISIDSAIYSRCILHQHIAQNRSLESLNFMEDDFIEKNRVNWIKGHALVSIDVQKNEITLDNNEKLQYDKLLIATGAGTKFCSVPGAKEAKNVTGFRTFDDALFIEKKLETVHDIVVIGSGFEAVDVIVGLLTHETNIALVTSDDRILPIQLDEHCSKVYEKLFEEAQVTQYYNTQPKEYILDENGNCTKVILENGVEIPTELVVDCTGISPNIQFLENTGILCDEYGLVYDDLGQTNIENIYGAGDVSGRLPIWPSAVKEGLIAGSNMAGSSVDMEDFFVSKASVHLFGLHTVGLGNPNYYDEDCEIVVDEDEEGNYKKAIIKNGRIVGAILQGDVLNVGVLTQLIQREVDISQIKKPLFEIGFADFFRMDDNFVYENGFVEDI